MRPWCLLLLLLVAHIEYACAEDVEPNRLQKIIPKQLFVPELPRLDIEPSVPGLLKFEYASNGYIEVGHATLVIPSEKQSRSSMLALARQLTVRGFALRPSLSEIDLTLYAQGSGTIQGYGASMPLLTASVPRNKLSAFVKFTQNRGTYGRVWEASQAAYMDWRIEERIPSKPAPFVRSTPMVDNIARRLSGLNFNLFYRGVSRKQVALTFDDAPHPLYLPLLLDLLKRVNVKATFFCIGRNAEAYPYFVKDMVVQGHELGNHTYNHIRLPGLSQMEVQNELEQTSQVLERLTHENVRFFRPPGGRYNAQTLAVARSLGLITVFWTSDSGDFMKRDESDALHRMQKISGGGIVLLHDNSWTTIQGLSGFIESARIKGLTVGTVGELMDGGEHETIGY
ncbi:MAG: polysaccharide deacetylase family protein [Deinococcaceae bacterium]